MAMTEGLIGVVVGALVALSGVIMGAAVRGRR